MASPFAARCRWCGRRKSLRSRRALGRARGRGPHPKNIQALRTLFNVAHRLAATLGTAWEVILETLGALERALDSPRRRRRRRRRRSRGAQTKRKQRRRGRRSRRAHRRRRATLRLLGDVRGTRCWLSWTRREVSAETRGDGRRGEGARVARRAIVHARAHGGRAARQRPSRARPLAHGGGAFLQRRRVGDVR